ncbi:hypothetical protein QUF74_03430 [Candidatus Halobeggiatoa sp. HSG11]|nr:hypothetical protein [Candidatus Halobeggiatoa sp. HSG11]
MSKPEDKKKAKQYDETFWETNEQIFFDSKIFGEYIHILRRWEMENYLLKPEALQKLMVNKKLSRNVMSVNSIAKKLINKEKDFITITILSTNGVNTSNKIREVFGKQLNGQNLGKKVKEHLQIDDSIFSEHYSKIEAFAEQEQDNNTRWDKLSRLLDGKRVLARLERKDMFGNIFKDMTSERGALADIIKNNDLVDTELEDFFDKVLN